MTNGQSSSELTAPAWFAEEIQARSAEPDALSTLESSCLEGILRAPFADRPEWRSLRAAALEIWRSQDHVVLRGIPAAGGGASLMWAAALFGSPFRTYGQGRMVKHFKMSPWTTELSHTLQEGHFHTDLNTAPRPPSVTLIQCAVADPGAPAHGQVRVARVRPLLERLSASGEAAALAFLEQEDVTMVNDSSPGAWTGKIVSKDGMRFHPETIRAAERRAGRDGRRHDGVLEAVKRAAVDVSQPIDLAVGDTLIVSNARALHYRNACTVRFRRFPTDFEAREIYVGHLAGEPA